jgi:hypothetical protein
MLIMRRPMSTTVEDRTVQRVAGVEEQGSGKGVWEVLEEILVLLSNYACMPMNIARRYDTIEYLFYSVVHSSGSGSDCVIGKQAAKQERWRKANYGWQLGVSSPSISKTPAVILQLFTNNHPTSCSTRCPQRHLTLPFPSYQAGAHSPFRFHLTSFQVKTPITSAWLSKRPDGPASLEEEQERWKGQGQRSLNRFSST